jgi:hypothetical protein
MGNPAVVLAPGVVRIPTLGDFINSFAFTDSDGSVTLVDAHPDHAGGAGAMLGATGVAGVDAHEADAEYLRKGSAPARDKSTTSGRIFERLPTSGFGPIPVASELKDGVLITAFTHGPEIRDHARERIRQFLRTKGHHE